MLHERRKKRSAEASQNIPLCLLLALVIALLK